MGSTRLEVDWVDGCCCHLDQHLTWTPAETESRCGACACMAAFVNCGRAAATHRVGFGKSVSSCSTEGGPTARITEADMTPCSLCVSGLSPRPMVYAVCGGVGGKGGGCVFSEVEIGEAKEVSLWLFCPPPPIPERVITHMTHFSRNDNPNRQRDCLQFVCVQHQTALGGECASPIV